MDRQASLKTGPFFELPCGHPCLGRRSARARPTSSRTSTHLRRAKLVAAFAVTALVGLGSYAATYRALVIVSEPPAAPGSIVPVSSGAAHTATVPDGDAHPPLAPMSAGGAVRPVTAGRRRLPLAQRHHEAGAAVVVDRRLGAHRAAHGGGQLGHDGQPEPRAHLAVRPPVGPVEAFEDPVQVAGRDAGSVVVDRDDAAPDAGSSPGATVTWSRANVMAFSIRLASSWASRSGSATTGRRDCRHGRPSARVPAPRGRARSWPPRAGIPPRSW